MALRMDLNFNSFSFQYLRWFFESDGLQPNGNGLQPNSEPVLLAKQESKFPLASSLGISLSVIACYTVAIGRKFVNQKSVRTLD